MWLEMNGYTWNRTRHPITLRYDGRGPGEGGSGSEEDALDDDKVCGCRGDHGSHGLWLVLGLLTLHSRRRRLY